MKGTLESPCPVGLDQARGSFSLESPVLTSTWVWRRAFFLSEWNGCRKTLLSEARLSPARLATGKELDPDFVADNSQNRRIHFGPRNYFSNRGGFAQVDPLLLTSSSLPTIVMIDVSPYTYAHSRPTGVVDPTGLKGVELSVGYHPNPYFVEPITKTNRVCSLLTCCVNKFWQVRHGKMRGGYDILDYWENLADFERPTDKKQLGPFIEKFEIGLVVQFLSKVSANQKLCTFTQEVTVNASKGHPMPPEDWLAKGEHNDVARSGKKQDEPPFRQLINKQPSFADPVSLPRHKNNIADYEFVTCFHSGGDLKNACRTKKCCINWIFDLKFDDKGIHTFMFGQVGKTKCD